MRHWIAVALKTVASIIDTARDEKVNCPPSLNNWRDGESRKAAMTDAAFAFVDSDTLAGLGIVVQGTVEESEVKLVGDVPPEYWPAVSATMEALVKEVRFVR